MQRDTRRVRRAVVCGPGLREGRVERDVYMDCISVYSLCADVDVEVGVRGGVRVDMVVSFEFGPQFCFMTADCSVMLLLECSIQGNEAEKRNVSLG
jgi:hypothetical protein